MEKKTILSKLALCMVTLFAATLMQAMDGDEDRSIRFTSEGNNGANTRAGYAEAVQSLHTEQLEALRAKVTEPGVLHLNSNAHTQRNIDRAKRVAGKMLIHQQHNSDRARRVSEKMAKQRSHQEEAALQELEELQRLAAEARRKESESKKEDE